jgi:hypothetical protein
MRARDIALIAIRLVLTVLILLWLYRSSMHEQVFAVAVLLAGVEAFNDFIARQYREWYNIEKSLSEAYKLKDELNKLRDELSVVRNRPGPSGLFGGEEEEGPWT